MGAMSAEAVEARKAYQREYRLRNRDKINSRRKNWRAENRDRVRQSTGNTGSAGQERRKASGHHGRITASHPKGCMN